VNDVPELQYIITKV